MWRTLIFMRTVTNFTFQERNKQAQYIFLIIHLFVRFVRRNLLIGHKGVYLRFLVWGHYKDAKRSLVASQSYVPTPSLRTLALVFYGNSFRLYPDCVPLPVPFTLTCAFICTFTCTFICTFTCAFTCAFTCIFICTFTCQSNLFTYVMSGEGAF
jgi:hypothetical protein